MRQQKSKNLVLYHTPCSALYQGIIPACSSELRDTLANIVGDVCYDIEVEPSLQLLGGKSLTTNLQALIMLAWISKQIDSAKLSFNVKFFNQLAKPCPKEVNKAYKAIKNLKY